MLPSGEGAHLQRQALRTSAEPVRGCLNGHAPVARCGRRRARTVPGVRGCLLFSIHQFVKGMRRLGCEIGKLVRGEPEMSLGRTGCVIAAARLSPSGTRLSHVPKPGYGL